MSGKMDTVTLTVEMTTEAMPAMMTITVTYVQRAIVTQTVTKTHSSDCRK